MRKRIAQAALTAALVSTLVVTPVFATPSVDDLQENKAAAENEMSSLQAELTQTLDKISTLESDLTKKQEEIEKASADLNEASYQQEQQYNAMKLRIKYMYEEGNDSVIETLLSAENFSDLINKAEYVQNVHSYDRNKLNEYIETAKKVEDLKENLQEEATTLQATQTELETEKAGLSATIESKQGEIAQLDQSIQDALAAQQAAEEAARQAQQQAAAEASSATADSGNGNGGGQQGGDSSNTGNTGSGGGSSYVPPQGSDGWAVVSYARQFIGNPYVYGGNSLTNGIDCSGFTQQIYAAFGVSLGRTTWDQESAGVGIPFSEARAGDLIVYEGHVGIYNGSGGLVHASSPGVGIIESGSCTYRTIKTVRRVL